jgi:glycosyltransferase involved in cell wall biosynthesis
MSVDEAGYPRSGPTSVLRERTGACSALLVGNLAPTSNRVSGELAKRLRVGGWSVISVSDRENRFSRMLDMVSTTWKSRKQYSIAQVDVYSGQAFLWAEAVNAVLKRAGKPVVLTLHGGNLPGFARKNPRRVRRLLASAKVVTTPSRYLQGQMSAYRSDLVLIPNGLDLTSLNFQLRERAFPRVVWVRAFHELYNPSMAARVIARLSQIHPNITATMVGPDKLDGSLQRFLAMAESLGVRDRFTVTGRIPPAEVGSWLNRADIFLNTAMVDNTPGSVMEAMAAGLCVVSTDAGGMPYLIDNGEDGLLSPTDDAEAMARNVNSILLDSSLASRLSYRARKKAEGFDWEFVLPRWTDLLNSVVARC